jgi:hypothetical protein
VIVDISITAALRPSTATRDEAKTRYIEDLIVSASIILNSTDDFSKLLIIRRISDTFTIFASPPTLPWLTFEIRLNARIKH